MKETKEFAAGQDGNGSLKPMQPSADPSAAKLDSEPASSANPSGLKLTAWMYEHDGQVYEKEPPIVTPFKWSSCNEPWTETPLYALPPGYVLVPEEPTKEMIEAGFGPFLAAHDLMFCKNEPCGPIYKAMLAAVKEKP